MLRLQLRFGFDLFFHPPNPCHRTEALPDFCDLGFYNAFLDERPSLWPTVGLVGIADDLPCLSFGPAQFLVFEAPFFRKKNSSILWHKTLTLSTFFFCHPFFWTWTSSHPFWPSTTTLMIGSRWRAARSRWRSCHWFELLVALSTLDSANHPRANHAKSHPVIPQNMENI